MPVKKGFTPNAPRPNVATATGTPDVQQSPGLVRQAAVNAKGDAPSVPPPVRDEITTALGGTWFVTGHRIDGCEDPAGRRYTFSRWYPDQHVVVDAFAKQSDAVKLEVARKSAYLASCNESAEQKIGYLPYVVGADLHEAVAQRAALGEIVELQAPQPLTV